MITEEVKGLVIRTTDIKESDRILNIFTEELGLISALATITIPAIEIPITIKVFLVFAAETSFLAVSYTEAPLALVFCIVNERSSTRAS